MAGNPERPLFIDSAWLAWRGGLVVRLIDAADENRDSDDLYSARLAVLADALEEAGCQDQRLLVYLREPSPDHLDYHLLDGLRSAARFSRGDLLPHYEFLGLLVSSQDRIVLKVWDRHLKRQLALKTTSGVEQNNLQKQRLLREARAQAAVVHPQVVQLHVIFEYHGQGFLGMEFVEGGSLAERLDGTAWSPTKAAGLIQMLAEGVHTVHQRGIVHLDINPSHVLLTKDGQPKLTGFGLARPIEERRGGCIAGIVRYLSPEQVTDRADVICPASDVHALGTIFYELLTGSPPFNGATIGQVLRRIAKDRPIPPRRLQPAVPRNLETICLRCLEKQPHRRYATAELLAADLTRVLASNSLG
jgi:serine/threonine-protein kinase